jgi:hypothetical protein
VADGDPAISPDVERQFAARMDADTVELFCTHVAMVSQLEEALERITTAAGEVVARRESDKAQGVGELPQ